MPRPKPYTLRPTLLPGLQDPGIKGFRDGTHRLFAPERTIQRAMTFAPVMGITRVANVTGLDVIGIPVVMVTRPNARALAVSQGKGLTLAAAKASGLMESVESYHAENIQQPLKLASYEALRYSHNVVDVTLLPQMSGGRWHNTLRTLWIEGYDLLQGEPVWLPYELVHTDYTLPLPDGSGSFPMTSNGLASGNHLLEAVSHGISEVVERDATTLWRFSPQAAQDAARVDLNTVDDPACREALDKYAVAQMTVAVWDTTSDVGLPAFVCTITDRADQSFRRLYTTSGMGCHPSREIALLRALTEAAQSRLTLISGARDDMTLALYERHRSPDTLQEVREHLQGVTPTRLFSAAPTFGGETFDEDVRHQLSRLERAGITRVIAVDLTHPALRLPVVRIVIPGLEAINDTPGYTPGSRARAGEQEKDERRKENGESTRFR